MVTSLGKRFRSPTVLVICGAVVSVLHIAASTSASAQVPPWYYQNPAVPTHVASQTVVPPATTVPAPFAPQVNPQVFSLPTTAAQGPYPMLTGHVAPPPMPVSYPQGPAYPVAPPPEHFADPAIHSLTPLPAVTVSAAPGCGPEASYGHGIPCAGTCGPEGVPMPRFSGAPNSGYFLSGEAMYMFLNAPSVTDFGDPTAERDVTVNGVDYRFENNLDTRWMKSEAGWGERFDFGYLGCSQGWTASVWNMRQSQSFSATGVNFAPLDPFTLLSGFEENANGIDADIDGDNVYGRNGEDLGTPDNQTPPNYNAPFDGVIDTPAAIDTDDLVLYLPTFSQVQSRNQLKLFNFDLNHTHRIPGACWNEEFALFYGIRYMEIEDLYSVHATGGVLDASFWDAKSVNHLVGPQLGARYLRRVSSFGLSVEGRFFAAFNQQDNDLQGVVATNAVVGGRDAPVSLSSQAFIDNFTNSEFSPAGELRIDTTYKMSRCLAFKLGYTGLVIDNISRSSPKIVYSLPESSLRDVDSDTFLVGHAITFGLELNR